MPEVMYELKVEDHERAGPVAMMVIAYDSEGENLGGVPVALELIDAAGKASLSADGRQLKEDVVTNPQGKVYFSVYPPDGGFTADVVQMRATWTGTDPFVFIERFREQ